MKIILSPHGGSGNHGCEAIVRSTIKILQEGNFELFSSNPKQDIQYGLEQCCKVSIPESPIKRSSIEYLWAKLSGNTENIDKLAFSPIFKAARKSDLMLSIGGDNYCYGINKHILLVNRGVRKLGKKTVLWGCSIEPEVLDDKSAYEDLQAFNLIVARESLTYETLRGKGIDQVVLYPDPAFQLARIDKPLPDGFMEGNTVGINISPMIIAHETNDGSTLSNYINLIEYILESSDMNIVLIPHVVWEHNDDRKPLELLYHRFSSTGRIVLLKDAPASELKGYIARCRFFVAARTHASIAAYSQNVPTLVIGYSIKARGIAHDIFGTEDNYVIPVQSLTEDNQLIEAFQYLQQNEEAIKLHYASMMPQYKARAAEAGQEIFAL